MRISQQTLRSVLAVFEARPGEALYADDVAIALNLKTHNAEAALAHLVTAGLLRRRGHSYTKGE